MLKVLEKYHKYKETYLSVKEQLAWLRNIAHILGAEGSTIIPGGEPPDVTSESKEKELFKYLEKLKKEKHFVGNDFINNVIKWTNNLKVGLFQCYDHPIIPRTNNDMERYLRKLKGQNRKITGRQSWNNYILRFGPYIAFHDTNDNEDKIIARLKKAKYSDFLKTMGEWDSSQEKKRKRFRYKRNPEKYLTTLEDLWDKI